VKISAPLVVLLAIILTAPPAAAQVVVATGVAEDATEANSQPKIGIDHRGTVYLTFVKPSAGVQQVFLASSTDGRLWRVQQVTRAAAHARYPALAIGPDDSVHLAWTQYDNGVGRVYYARYDGRRWSAAAKVSPGDAYAGVPALVADSQGTVHLVWYGIRAQAPTVRTRHGSIYEILYTAHSGGRWREPEVISPGIPDAVNPALALDDLGRLHSAWYQFDLRNYQARHTVRERRWEQPVTISSGRADSLGVTLATGPGGATYVVWERRESAGSRIYLAEHRGRWSGQQQASPGSQDAFNPTAAVDERGSLYVAWDSDGHVYLRRRDGTWRGADRVTATGRNTQPAIAAGRGAVVLMWTQQTAGDTRVEFATVAGSIAGPATRVRFPWGVILVALIVLGVAWWRRTIRGRAVAQSGGSDSGS